MQGEPAVKPSDFHNGALVRGACVRVSGEAARVGLPGSSFPPASEGDKGGEPRIEIVRNGEAIQAIDIVCGCGQHIRLHCLYSETR